jgi:hypothetical protein
MTKGKSNGKDEPQDGPAAGPVVVAQIVLDPGRQRMGIFPGPMVNDHVAFYASVAASASAKVAELLHAERLESESRKKLQILVPGQWPGDLKGGPQG